MKISKIKNNFKIDKIIYCGIFINNNFYHIGYINDMYIKNYYLYGNFMFLKTLYGKYFKDINIDFKFNIDTFNDTIIFNMLLPKDFLLLDFNTIYNKYTK